MRILHSELAAPRLNFYSLTSKKKQDFLTRLPFLLNDWFSGVAMNNKFEVDASTEIISAWGTAAFRTLVEWMNWFAEANAHDTTTLYRLVSIPYTDKKRLKLQPGRNALHSWTTDPEVCKQLYHLAYKNHKQSQRWSYLIVKGSMPGARIAITHAEASLLCNWVLNNITELHKSAELLDTGLYSIKNCVRVWTDLLRRLNTQLIVSQKEFICLGRQSINVEVICVLPTN